MNSKSLAIGLVGSVAITVSSCRVITAPYHYLWRSPEPTPAPTSDVAHPGRPVPVPSPTPRATPRKSTRPSPGASSKPSPAKKSSSTASSSQFPTAKPVPGKPGLVFNPFKPNGAYIDVSGYAAGSKVKDPDTQKIFIVP